MSFVAVASFGSCTTQLQMLIPFLSHHCHQLLCGETAAHVEKESKVDSARSQKDDFPVFLIAIGNSEPGLATHTYQNPHTKKSPHNF